MPARNGRPVVLITGAASGIGAATAEAFADHDWIVYATDTESGFPTGVDAQCRCLELNVTDAHACEAVVEHVVDEAGRIDVLVNNAGFAVPGPVEDVSVKAAQQQFDTLVHGAHAMIRAVLPAMHEQGVGRLIMLSSVLGVTPSPGVGIYGAAKAAVESLTDSLRMELRSTSISVSLVEPAWVNTDFSARATERLPTGRTSAYSALYESIESGWVVDGGPLASTPETVASTVIEAATAETPATRYPVGGWARFVVASRLLPTSVRDPVTTWALRQSTTARQLWPFESVTAGSEKASAAAGSEEASLVQLSTGHEVSVPLSTAATISGVVLSASAREVDTLLPDSLRPVRFTPQRSALTLMSVEYSRIGDREIDPYNEVAMILPAVPDSAVARLPLVSTLAGGVGGYVWQLPVTTEPARALGDEIWGYPKSVAEIEISHIDGQMHTQLTVDGQRVISLAVDQPPRRSGELSLSSYTTFDGHLCRTTLTFAGALGGRPLSRRADWELGDHPWADTLDSLALGSRPLARFGGDCEFSIGEPTFVDDC